MNDTKWTEIFREFYYGVECAGDPHLSQMHIPWTTRTTDGYMYSDSTWTHFGAGGFRELDWLRIDLTRENRSVVLDILRKIHVPGEIREDCVYVYGYRTDADYIQ